MRNADWYDPRIQDVELIEVSTDGSLRLYLSPAKSVTSYLDYGIKPEGKEVDFIEKWSNVLKKVDSEASKQIFPFLPLVFNSLQLYCIFQRWP